VIVDRLADASAALDADRLARLRETTIFFGHQSVGQNIVDGMTDVLASVAGAPSIVEGIPAAGFPGFHHARIGRNDHPGEKIADFERAAATAFTGTPGVALMKLCYVDIHVATDVRALFDGYRHAMDRLRSAAPGLRIAHLTVPLTLAENWKGMVRATLTRAVTQRARNAARERLNDLIRTLSDGDGPVFDLARMESTRTDGSRVTSAHDGAAVPGLVPEYTDDGGHLNRDARVRAAITLLRFLADVVPARSAATSRHS
jgi:hypothetical protein